MLDWLDNLRRKPKALRKQYAFFGAILVTGLIASIWMFTLPERIATIKNVDNTPEKEAVGAFAKFFSEAKSNIGSVIMSSVTKKEEPVSEKNDKDEPNPKQQNVIVPTISEENKKTLTEPSAPKQRTVLIGTTTRSSSTNQVFEN